MHKNGDRVFWKTEYCNDIKLQTIVTEDEQEEMRTYFNRRRELVSKEYRSLLSEHLSIKEAKHEAWKRAYLILWPEFHCCYYSCTGFQFNAFSDLERKTMLDIFELTRELAGIDPMSARKDELFAYETKE